MRAVFVMHDHVSPTGPVSQRLRERGFEVDELVVVDESNFATPNVPYDFPSLDDYDLIVPMGSPWGAWDDATIGAWLQPEIAWVQEAVARDIPVLGICFGGQLLARALGGSVAPGPKAEIGWTAIHSDDPSLVAAGPVVPVPLRPLEPARGCGRGRAQLGGIAGVHLRPQPRRAVPP